MWKCVWVLLDTQEIEKTKTKIKGSRELLAPSLQCHSNRKIPTWKQK
jgi:hypothetical protein